MMTVRDVLVKIKMQVEQTNAMKSAGAQLAGTAADPKIIAAKRRSEVLDKKHVADIGQLTEAQLARSRRAEEMHQERMLALRQKNELQIAGLRARLSKTEAAGGAYQGDGAKGFAKNAGGDSGMLVATAAGLALSVMKFLPDILDNLSADASGKGDGGFFTALNKRIGSSLYTAGKEIVTGHEDTVFQFADWALNGFGKDRLKNSIDTTTGSRLSDRLFPGDQKRGAGFAKPAATPDQAREKNLNLMELEKDRLERLIDARSKLVKAEEDGIRAAEQKMEQERGKQKGFLEEFGALSKGEQLNFKLIADKIQKSGMASLSSEEMKFVHGNRGFSDALSEEFVKNAKAAGGEDLFRQIGGNRGLVQAEEERAFQRMKMERKDRQFNIENKIEINVDLAASLEENRRKLNAVLEEKFKKLKREFEDDLARMQQQINVGGGP